MDDQRRFRRKDDEPPSEGVRIIGPDEAAEAMERPDVAARRRDDEPRFGDRPAEPPAGPRPALRFPLDAAADPSRIERPPVDPAPDPVTGPVELPHWTEPPTGEVPSVLIGDGGPLLEDDDEDLDAWSSFATSAPRWRDADDEWDDDDFMTDLAQHSGEFRVGALADGEDDERPEPDDYHDFDDLEQQVEERTADRPRWRDDEENWAASEGAWADEGDEEWDDDYPAEGRDVDPVPIDEPTRDVAAVEADDEVDEIALSTGELAAIEADDARLAAAEAEVGDDGEDGDEPVTIVIGDADARGRGRDEPVEEPDVEVDEVEEPVAADDADEVADDGYYDDEGYEDDEPRGGGLASRFGPVTESTGERNMTTAVGVGVGLAAVALVALIISPALMVGVITLALGFAAFEYFNVLDNAEWESASLLGIAACVALPLAIYWRGPAYYPMLLFIVFVAILAWFLVGAGGRDPRVLEGSMSTLFGVIWIGGFGSSGAGMLALHDGRWLLLVAILATVAYDVGGLFIGKYLGQRPLSAASPNKTVEGLVGGMALAFAITIVTVGIAELGPWNGFGAALLLGLGAACAAPLGDLSQSLLKRDLGIKDMGSVLPGHGGLLDRFDSMLFVLPTVFWLTVAVGLS